MNTQLTNLGAAICKELGKKWIDVTQEEYDFYAPLFGDMYRVLATKRFNKPIKDITDEERQQMKNEAFSRVYGSTNINYASIERDYFFNGRYGDDIIDVVARDPDPKLPPGDN